MMRASDLFAALPERLGLGLGLDMPWGERIGFERNYACGDRIGESVRAFLLRHGAHASHLFVAFQPRDRQKLDATNYFAALDDFFDAAPGSKVRALHHTMLNTGAIDEYRRADIAAFTNDLCERYGFAWIVEDLGIWSVQGKVMPYPLPPLLTSEGLDAAIANVGAWQHLLAAPLSLEFPGFTDGSNFFIGRMHAYEFFRKVVDATGVAVTLDIGHLLSYQWLRGARGEALYAELDQLPLEQCFEFHLSGCVIAKDRFRDAHHGVLLDEQITLCERLLPLCPNLRAITYEDPKFDQHGELIAKAQSNVDRLRRIARDWLDAGPLARLVC